MPLTEDELIGFRQKRREAILRLVAVFASLCAAAIMVFFVIRLVSKRLESDRRARIAAQSEKRHFESNVATTRPQRSDVFGEPRQTPREIIPNTDVVDMTARSPSRAEYSAAANPVAPPASAASATPAPAPAAPASPSAPKVIENLDRKQAAIALVMREFFEARSVAQMLPLVRDSRRVRPLMEDFYQRTQVRTRTWKGIGWAIPVEEPGYRFAYVQATFSDAPPVNIVVEETNSGFLVDWESSVQYSELGWKEFMTTRPGEPKVFRVIASKAEGTSGAGTVLSLKHPQEDGVVLGRFDAKDPRFRSLVEQLDLCKWKDVPVILRLCYPGPAEEASEVQIAGVEGKGWLILGTKSHGS